MCSLSAFGLCAVVLACMRTESSLRCAMPCGRETRMRTTARGALVLVDKSVCLLVSYRTLARLVLETSSVILAVCAHLRSGWNTPTASCSSAPRAPRLPRAKSIVYWQFGTPSRRDPRPKNDEHLLPLAGRQPGPSETRRGQPRGEPADHDALSKTSPARRSRPSRRIRTRKFAVTSGIRSLAKPEATHPA